MLDLDRQLREFGAFVDEAVEPVLAAEIIGPRSAPVRPVGRRHFAIALAAAALMILVIATVVILDPFGSEGPFIEEPTTIPTTTSSVTEAVPPTTTTVVEDTTMTTITTLVVPVITWERVFTGEASFETVESVARVGGGFIAVGTDLAAADAAIWRSSDGVAWERIAIDDA
ncbi:MAG: hypothetical protein RI637_07730, partial [Acidimicrobiia bacterium]|nr:hypothetical protein [Acidimicrobiia bacterium]